MRDRRAELCEQIGCWDYSQVRMRGLEDTPWGRRFHRWLWCLEHMAKNKPGWDILGCHVIMFSLPEDKDHDWPAIMVGFLNSPSPYTCPDFERRYDNSMLLYNWRI